MCTHFTLNDVFVQHFAVAHLAMERSNTALGVRFNENMLPSSAVCVFAIAQILLNHFSCYTHQCADITDIQSVSGSSSEQFQWFYSIVYRVPCLLRAIYKMLDYILLNKERSDDNAQKSF